MVLFMLIFVAHNGDNLWTQNSKIAHKQNIHNTLSV